MGLTQGREHCKLGNVVFSKPVAPLSSITQTYPAGITGLLGGGASKQLSPASPSSANGCGKLALHRNNPPPTQQTSSSAGSRVGRPHDPPPPCMARLHTCSWVTRHIRTTSYVNDFTQHVPPITSGSMHTHARHMTHAFCSPPTYQCIWHTY